MPRLNTSWTGCYSIYLPRWLVIYRDGLLVTRPLDGDPTRSGTHELLIVGATLEPWRQEAGTADQCGWCRRLVIGRSWQRQWSVQLDVDVD